MTTPIFSLKTNPAEEDNCPCQRFPEKPSLCKGTGAMTLEELRIKDGPHMDQVIFENSNPWADANLRDFSRSADAYRRSFEEGGYVQVVRNNGSRQIDLEE